jgi:hypothetical protein
MKALAWLVVAASGLGLMYYSYDRWMQIDPEAPWAYGFLCVGNEDATKKPQSTTILSTRLRFLPASATTEAILKSVELAGAGKTRDLAARLRPGLIELPATDMELLAGWLEEGRLPSPGRDEVLAGSQARAGAVLSVEGRTLSVVGVLKPSIALFADSYLVPADPTLEVIFPGGDASVRRAAVIRLGAREFGDPKTQAQIAEAYPSNAFAVLLPSLRTQRKAFLAFLAGQALFLLCGTGLLISLYCWLAGRVHSGVLAAPLLEMAQRPRLLWGVHLAYFGLYVLGAMLVQASPDLQTVLLSAVRGEISSSGKGPLAIAGQAYGTGNMFYAALVTFLVNFPLGSFAMISLPSMIIPGCGAVLATLRATLWGVLLGPSLVSLTRAMLPHTGTLLLEGEGYILATFFALVIPVYLFRPSQAPDKPSELGELQDFQKASSPRRNTYMSRLWSAVVLNLKANILVAIVLAVAACYEAFEVILMMNMR